MLSQKTEETPVIAPTSNTALEKADVGHTPPPRNVLLVFWERRYLVLLGVAAGVMVGGLVYVRSRSVYRSSARVLVIKKRADVMPIVGSDPSQTYLDDYVSTHIALLKSPLIIERAIAKRQLADLPTFTGQGNVAGVIIAGLTATRDGSSTSSSTTIIQLTFRGPVAEDTGTIVDAIISSYREFLDETYRNVSDDTLTLITKARDLLKRDVAKLEKKFDDFREKAPLGWVGKDGSAPQMRLREFETKRSALLIRQVELQEQISALEQARKEGTAHLLLAELLRAESDKPGALQKERTLEEDLEPLRTEERLKLINFGPDHPDVVAIRTKMAQVRKAHARKARLAAHRPRAVPRDAKAEDRVALHLGSLRRQLAQLGATGRALGEAAKKEMKGAKAFNRYENKEAHFRRDLARTQQLYDQTIKRLKEINLVRDFGGYQARVIDPAGLGVKVAPNVFQMLLAGLALGLLAGAGFAYLADVTDKSFRTPEEIRRRLGLPILGHIPLISATKNGTGSECEKLPPILCVAHRPSSREAEAYRALRTALYFGMRGQSHPIIQVTSPTQADGKSTLVANLGITIALAGKKVLLVDADLRRPRLERLFNIESGGSGLTSLLMEEADLQAHVRQTVVPGLSLLPCGLKPANPAELLTSPAFERVLGDLRAAYDYVLIDSPPLLAVTDPCIIASRVDGVILTIRVSKNGRSMAERAKEMLVALGVKVVGVAVNGVGKEKGGYGYGYGYGYRYYSYEEYESTENDPAAVATNGRHH
jgi:capsular exopolysaccharide synthesis family protein